MFVSPNRTFIITLMVVGAAPAVTPFRSTVISCAFGTPVKFTFTSLAGAEFGAGSVLTVPPLAVTPENVTGAGKTSTSWWFPGVPPRRGSIAGATPAGSGITEYRSCRRCREFSARMPPGAWLSAHTTRCPRAYRLPSRCDVGGVVLRTLARIRSIEVGPHVRRRKVSRPAHNSNCHRQTPAT